MGVSQMWIFSNQTECDAVYQLCSTSSVQPTNWFQDKPICRGYLSAWQTLLYTQGLMHKLYFEGISSEIEKYKFVNRLLYQNNFFNKRIWIITSFQAHCQFSKFAIRDMPFKTKLTSLIRAQGLYDSALQNIVRTTVVTLGVKTDSRINLFAGAIFLHGKLCYMHRV